MAAGKLILLVLVHATFSAEATKFDECVHDSDCRVFGNKSRAVCCKSNIFPGQCRESCVGLTCSEDDNCGGAYCCQYECRASCLNVSCISDSDCGSFKCCHYKCRESCIGQSCVIHEDCSDVKYCCNGICSEKCTGQSIMCSGENGNCGHNTFQKGTCGLSANITVFILVLILGIIATVVVVALSCYCLRRRRPAGFIGSDEFVISDRS